MRALYDFQIAQRKVFFGFFFFLWNITTDAIIGVNRMDVAHSAFQEQGLSLSTLDIFVQCDPVNASLMIHDPASEIRLKSNLAFVQELVHTCYVIKIEDSPG
jgi:hypothetical protein